MQQMTFVLAIKTRLYELLMWGLYEAYVPSYAASYEVLGTMNAL